MTGFLKRVCLVLCLLTMPVALGGCADQVREFKTFATNVVDVVGGVKIKSTTAYVAINTFNVAEAAATNFLRLPPCPRQAPVCRPLGAAAALEGPFNAGIAARNELRAWMKANPGTLADAGLYDSLVQATTSLKKVMAAYGINS